jgi:hypothetical protein
MKKDGSCLRVTVTAVSINVPTHVNVRVECTTIIKSVNLSYTSVTDYWAAVCQKQKATI